jgi:hypothetical protein
VPIPVGPVGAMAQEDERRNCPFFVALLLLLFIEDLNLDDKKFNKIFYYIIIYANLYLM